MVNEFYEGQIIMFQSFDFESKLMKKKVMNFRRDVPKRDRISGMKK